MVDGLSAVYSCTINKSVYSSSYIVYKKRDTLYQTRYVFDISIPDFKIMQIRMFPEIARTFERQCDEIMLQKADQLASRLLDKIFATEGNHQDLIQSIFFHWAIIKHNLRVKTKRDANFYPHYGYLVDETFFYDRRDALYEKVAVARAIEEYLGLTTDAYMQNLYAYVKSCSSKMISWAEIEDAYYVAGYDVIVNGIIHNVPPTALQKDCWLIKKQKLHKQEQELHQFWG